MEDKKIIMFLGAFLLLITISLNVNSAGVSSPYWDDSPLYARPGEIKEFSYTLQNMVGNEDIRMQATLEGDIKVISFVDQNNVYDVPFGSNNIPVKVRITAPKDAKEGDEYQVGVRFTVLSENVPGKPVAIGSAFSKGFKVIIGNPKPATNEIISEKPSNTVLSNQALGFLASIIILIILLIALKYFHKKRPSQ